MKNQDVRSVSVAFVKKPSLTQQQMTLFNQIEVDEWVAIGFTRSDSVAFVNAVGVARSQKARRSVVAKEASNLMFRMGHEATREMILQGKIEDHINPFTFQFNARKVLNL